jgi:hypothetical protein
LLSKFNQFPSVSLLFREVAAQDMWWWWRRICGGGGAGYVVCKLKIRLTQPSLVELGLGLSLAKAHSRGFQFFLTHPVFQYPFLSEKYRIIKRNIYSQVFLFIHIKGQSLLK